MKNLWKFIIVVILASSVLAVLILKNMGNKSEPVQTIIEKPEPAVAEPNAAVEPNQNQPVQTRKPPTMIELGADKCVPCKMMMPVIDELRTKYKGKLEVIFYDVWKNPEYAQKYAIEIIPTQIFLDPNEKELFRHQGYFPKEEILTKWEELGFELK